MNYTFKFFLAGIITRVEPTQQLSQRSLFRPGKDTHVLPNHAKMSRKSGLQRGPALPGQVQTINASVLLIGLSLHQIDRFHPIQQPTHIALGH